jgi:hypothetical protein
MSLRSFTCVLSLVVSVVFCPGGGYGGLADHEGSGYARCGSSSTAPRDSASIRNGWE